jgi:hypothetical protein
MSTPPKHPLVFLVLILTFLCWLPGSLVCESTILLSYLLVRPPRQYIEPVQIAERMDTIGIQVDGLTGIYPTHPVERKMITRADLAADIKKQFEAEYSPDQARKDALTYSVFGLMKGDEDLYQMYLNMYSEGVAGYYDPETGVIRVVSDSGFGPMEMRTYAHEYTHALQFQRYDIKGLGNTDEILKQDPERYLGLQALIEGEASMAEDMWSEKNFSRLDQWDEYKQEFMTIFSAGDIFQTPRFLWSFMFFPYEQGKAFAWDAFHHGGWEGLDAVFRHPPVSSEMILHPDRYRNSDQPIKLPNPMLSNEFPASQWTELENGSWGEYGMRILMETNLEADTIDSAATGWGGDAYDVWQNPQTGHLIGIWHTAWDTSQDANEFWDALLKWNNGRMSSSALSATVTCWDASASAICQAQSGKEIWWVYAPSQADAEALLRTNVRP